MKLTNKYNLQENLYHGRGLKLLMEHTRGHTFEGTVVAFMKQQGYSASAEESYVYDMNMGGAKCEIKLTPGALLGDISIKKIDTLAFDMKNKKFIVKAKDATDEDSVEAASFIASVMSDDAISVDNMYRLCKYAQMDVRTAEGRKDAKTFDKNIVYLRRDGRATYADWHAAKMAEDMQFQDPEDPTKLKTYPAGSPLNWHAGYIKDVLKADNEDAAGNKLLASIVIPGDMLTRYMAAKGVHYLICGDYGQNENTVDEGVMIGHLKEDILGLGTNPVVIAQDGKVTIGLRARGGNKEHGEVGRRPYGTFATVRCNTSAPMGLVTAPNGLGNKGMQSLIKLLNK